MFEMQYVTEIPYIRICFGYAVELQYFGHRYHDYHEKVIWKFLPLFLKKVFYLQISDYLKFLYIS